MSKTMLKTILSAALLAAVAAFATPSFASYGQLDTAAAMSAAAPQGAVLQATQTAAKPVVLAYKPDCKSRNGKNPCN